MIEYRCMKLLKEADLKNKKVLMRVGFDVVIDKLGNIIDDTRIKETIPSIKYILEQQPKLLTIISHLGRPDGKIVENLKLNNVANKLAELLNLKSEIKTSKSEIEIPQYKITDNIYLLENIRFYPEEENNDSEFAKKLASLGEVFIFEAFSAAHREHATTYKIFDFLPSYAGLEMEHEVSELSKLLGDVERPYLLVIGGAKTEDKVPIIDRLKNKTDKILVGGRTSNLLHQEKKYINDDKIQLTIDGIDQKKEVIKAEERPLDILDIGPETIKLFRAEIIKAKTILVAGPLGKIEENPFANGTKEIYSQVSKSNSYKVACGGDTTEALNKFGLFDSFNFVSTGGGAALEFLAKGTLPSIEKLNKNK